MGIPPGFITRSQNMVIPAWARPNDMILFAAVDVTARTAAGCFHQAKDHLSNLGIVGLHGNERRDDGTLSERQYWNLMKGQ